MKKKKSSDRISTGVAGLDEVLCGGFIPAGSLDDMRVVLDQTSIIDVAVTSNPRLARR